MNDGSTGATIAEIPNPEPGDEDLFGMTTGRLGDNLLVNAPATRVNGVPAAGVVYYIDAVDGSVLATIANPDPDADGLAISRSPPWATTATS